VKDLVFDSQGRLWITNGVDIFRQEGMDWVPMGAPSDLGSIHTLIIDDADVLWAGVGSHCDYWTGDCTLGGLLRYDGEFTLYNEDNSDLITSDIQALISDQRNRIWIGTRQGLFKLEEEVFTRYTEENSPLSYNKIMSLAVSPEGDLWIGTGWGQGLNVFNEGGIKGLMRTPGIPEIVAVPNPMHTYTDLSWTSKEKPEVISVRACNLLGQAQSLRFTDTATYLRLYRDKLSPGVYLVRVHTRSGYSSCKILIP
jgi:hypothetical protein